MKLDPFFVQIDGSDFRFLMHFIEGRDQVARQCLIGGWTSYEDPLPLVIKKICKDLAPIFVDVGANTGFYSILAASSGANFVYAFEPNPDVRSILEENIKLNRLNSVIRTDSRALGAANGTFPLYLPEASHGLIETSASLNREFRNKHQSAINVDVTTLDDILSREYIKSLAIDFNSIFLKMDVETLEPDVIEGASLFIKQFRPLVVTECLGFEQANFWSSFLSKNNYLLWRHEQDDIACLSPNFIFRESVRDYLLVPEEKCTQIRAILSPLTGHTSIK